MKSPQYYYLIKSDKPMDGIQLRHDLDELDNEALAQTIRTLFRKLKKENKNEGN